MYVMKFSTREGTYNNKHYHGKFVAIDYHSGGYPWGIGEEFSGRVSIFSTYEEARSYQETFKFLDIFELKIELKEIT